MNKLINIIKDDLKVLKENFIKDIRELKFSFEPELLKIAIKDEFYLFLNNAYISQLLDKKLIPNEEEFRTKKRIELFTNQFIKLHKKLLKNSTFQWIEGDYVGWFDSINLLKCLYGYLLNMYLNGKKNFDLLLDECKQTFCQFIKDQEMPIQIWIYLDGINVKKSVKIDSKFAIAFIENTFTITTKNQFSMRSINHPYLVYNTKIKTFFKNKGDNDNSNDYYKIIKKDWEEKWDNINIVLFSFYLSGLSFNYNEIILKPSWWIYVRSSDMDSLEKERLLIKPKSEELFKINSELNYKEIEKITEISDLIYQSNFMKKSRHALLINRYFQIYDRKSTQDRILDEFIILESIYTTSNKTEIAFRLSLNIASFLGENQEQFNDIYHFIRDIYSIRSTIVHGDEWKTLLRKEKISKYFELKDMSSISLGIFLKLKEFIDKTIIKIIKWEIDNSSSFYNKAKGLFFLNHRLN